MEPLTTAVLHHVSQVPEGTLPVGVKAILHLGNRAAVDQLDLTYDNHVLTPDLAGLSLTRWLYRFRDTSQQKVGYGVGDEVDSILRTFEVQRSRSAKRRRSQRFLLRGYGVGPSQRRYAARYLQFPERLDGVRTHQARLSLLRHHEIESR